MADAYSEGVRDHFEHPRHVGSLKHPDAIGAVENPVTGASLVLHLAICDRAIESAVFKAQGCAATIACGSVLTVLLNQKTIDHAQTITRDQIEVALGGLPPTRKHAADLAVDALQSALADLERRLSAPSTK